MSHSVVLGSPFPCNPDITEIEVARDDGSTFPASPCSIRTEYSLGPHFPSWDQE